MRHYEKNRAEGQGSDEDWFERFRNGDSRSMTVVFDRHFTKLVKYLEGRSVDTFKAEEIASGALQKAWERRKSYESKAHLNNSLFAIVKNDCISLNRKRKVEDRMATELRQMQSDEFAVNRAVDPNRARAEALNMLWPEIYKRLDKQNADMLWFHFEDRLSDAEIAEVYQIHKGKIRGMRSRALQKLRKALRIDRFYLLILLLLHQWK